MPDPLLGFSLQSFAPPVQPFAVSGAVALLSLRRAVEPPEDPLSRRERRNAAPVRQIPMVDGPSKRPRLQGFAPHESPSLRTDGLGRLEHVALLGFVPFRVFPLTGMATAFTAPPLMWLSVWAQAPSRTPYRVFLPGEVGLPLSRPPTLLGFATS
jgi:hypothetical protein